MSGPRVSIVLPSRNGSRYLAAAIGSVAAQTFGDWELILVDDASTDDTGAVMRAFGDRDPRIRVVRLPVNRGLPGALNEGFRHARGALFGWTSDDNLLLPGAIERMATFMRESGQDPLRVLLSGGAAAQLRPLMAQETIAVDNLVLEGLVTIAQEER